MRARDRALRAWRVPARRSRRAFLARVGKGGLGPVRSGLAVAASIAPILPRAGGSTRSPGAMPSFDPATWRLTVEGLVEKPPRRYTSSARCRRRQVSTFHCVTGWTVRTCAGRVRIGRARGARPSPRPARWVRLGRGALRRLPDAEQAALPDVMLAYEMDGGPLPREHGAPLRLVIPDMYGYKNVKWVSGSSSSPRAPVTGSSSVTTVMPGSATRTATRSRARESKLFFS